VHDKLGPRALSVNRKLGARRLKERSDDSHAKPASSLRVKVARQSRPLVSDRNQGRILALGRKADMNGAADIPGVGVLGCIRDQFADKKRNKDSPIGSHANSAGCPKIDDGGRHDFV
jgi:hypothetical protein